MVQRPQDRDLLPEIADVLRALPVLRDELQRYRLPRMLPPPFVYLVHEFSRARRGRGEAERKKEGREGGGGWGYYLHTQQYVAVQVRREALRERLSDPHCAFVAKIFGSPYVRGLHDSVT